MQKNRNGRCTIQGQSKISYVCTRVDITFGMSMVSQFMLNASPPHWMAMKRIMWYLKGTLDFKLYLGGKDIAMRIGQEIQTTSDPPWDTCFFVGVGVISWKCKKQLVIALAMIEAEYMATSLYTKEVVWFRQFLADVGYVQEGPTSIMCNYE